MLARYNRIANERLFAKCGQLDDAEYRKGRAGSFGSIHGLLNHILLGDRRWMGLFESGGRVTPPLNQILHDDFLGLESARAREDARIEAFFAKLDDDFLEPVVRLHEQSGQRLRGDGTRGMQSSVQSPDAPSRASPRDAESDRGGASITRLASYRQSLESADCLRLGRSIGDCPVLSCGSILGFFHREPNKFAFSSLRCQCIIRA